MVVGEERLWHAVGEVLGAREQVSVVRDEAETGADDADRATMKVHGRPGSLAAVGPGASAVDARGRRRPGLPARPSHCPRRTATVSRRPGARVWVELRSQHDLPALLEQDRTV